MLKRKKIQHFDSSTKDICRNKCRKNLISTFYEVYFCWSPLFISVGYIICETNYCANAYTILNKEPKYVNST